MNGNGSVFTLIDEPTYVADIDSFIAGWVQQHFGSAGEPSLSEVTGDKRSTVKRIWEALNDPDRPTDSASVDRRLNWLRYLGTLLKMESIPSTADLRNHLERYLSGYDGRRLPVAKAIKRARKNAGLSQQDLAELLGLRDHTLISKYESGRRVPPVKVLEWLKENEAENVTRKRRVKGNGRVASESVTPNRGNKGPISLDLAKSVTTMKPRECPTAEDPAPKVEDLAQMDLFQPGDPEAPTAPASDAIPSAPSTGEDSNE